MDYLRSGTVRDMPEKLKFPFAKLRMQVDRAVAAYEKKCSTLAENGAKGGKAKAAKANSTTESKSKATTKFNPPTLKQFREAVAHFYDNDELGDREDEPDDYDIDCLFDELKDASWQIEGEPIQSRQDWEILITSRLGKWSFLPFSDEPYIKYLFGKYHGLRDSNGKTQADTIACDFCEKYDAEKGGWTVDGEFYPKAKWREALDKHVALWQER